MIRFNKKTVIVLLVISALIVGVVLHAHHRNAEKNSAFLFDQIPKEEINYDSIQEMGYATDYVSDIEKPETAAEEEAKSAAEEEARKKERQEEAYLQGVKEKELSSVQGINDAVILLNSEEITRREIGQGGEQQDAAQLKRNIIVAIRKLVVKQAAIRRGITVTQEEVDAFVSEQKQNDQEEIVKSYINGLGIDEEKYWEVFRQSAYDILQCATLKDEILSSRKEKFIAAAEKRGATLDAVQNEYWESYVDDLVLKSHIKILDPELKKLFGVEEKAS